MTGPDKLDLYARLGTNSAAVLAAAASSLAPSLVLAVSDHIVDITTGVARHFLMCKDPLPLHLHSLASKEGAASFALNAVIDEKLVHQSIQAYERGYIVTPDGSEASNAILKHNGFAPDAKTLLVDSPDAVDPVVYVAPLVFAMMEWNLGHLHTAMNLFGVAFPGQPIDFGMFVTGRAWLMYRGPRGIPICLVLVAVSVLAMKLVGSHTSGVTDEKSQSALKIGCLGGRIGNTVNGGTGGVMSMLRQGIEALRATGKTGTLLELVSAGAASMGELEERAAAAVWAGWGCSHRALFPSPIPPSPRCPVSLLRPSPVCARSQHLLPAGLHVHGGRAAHGLQVHRPRSRQVERQERCVCCQRAGQWRRAGGRHLLSTPRLFFPLHFTR